jgi:hypothetical protein
MKKKPSPPAIVFFRGEQRLAAYIEQEVPFYRGNPFIEALPPVLNEQQVEDCLGYYPDYDTSYRLLSSEARLQMIQDSTQFFQVLPVHFDLQQRISRMIRSGYRNRNPMERGHWRDMDQRIRSLAPSTTLLRNTARPLPSGFTIIGLPGVGKTSSIEGVLSLYPQVISHGRYKERELTCSQIAWLKLEAPFDSSIKGLCLQFFAAVDDVLGTNYQTNAGGKNTDELLLQIARVAANHGLGMLVIDEIQRLSQAKSGGAERMLNFFVQLANTIGVPILLVGTPKARHVLSGQFHQIRRGLGQGDMIWDRMPEGQWVGEDDLNTLPGVWQLFVEALWMYQYTRTPTALTAELAATLYEQSQGIVDIAAKLYMLAQARAITTTSDGQELLTSVIIRSVAIDSLRQAQPVLKALRMGDTRALSEYDDMQPLDLRELIQQSQQSLFEVTDQEEEGATSQSNATSTNSTANQNEIGSAEKAKGRSSRKKTAENHDADDLRIILDHGKNPQVSAADRLREAGHLQSAPEDERRDAA